MTTLILAVALLILALFSLFIGVIDLDLESLAGGDAEQWKIFLASRLPRLLAILCTGVGMSVKSPPSASGTRPGWWRRCWSSSRA